MNVPAIPSSTYRLQFNRNFTFTQATELVPYLSSLGISHVYASPYLRARPGSMHGYDIIDHNQLNPEVGTPEEFERFVDVLQEHGMGQILDIVPNHMGVMGSDNAWWLDVLENGESSNFASFFDIDWQPLKDELQGKVLVPVLDDQYGVVLDKGELKLDFDGERGECSICYHQNRFPIDPREYPRILGRRIEPPASGTEAEDPAMLELQSLISAFSHLPSRASTNSEEKAERNRDKEIHKARLAALCVRSAPVAALVNQNVRAINGEAGQPRSFDELHELIKAQAFRLAYWRVAADDINYRRFFDINDLAGLRMEDEQVFEATHRLITRLVREGKVNGLRIDHPDGLFDPAQYFQLVQQCKPQYVVVEKILTGDEPLSAEWPVQGTTGYDFSNLVNGLFVAPSSAAKMCRGYRGFTGEDLDFDAVLYACKKTVMDNALASELNVLANLLSRIALSNRHTCDFTLNSLRDALGEIVAQFPVYRTYLTEGRISEKDRGYIEAAIHAAKKRATSQDTSVYDFIRHVLLEPGKESASDNNYRKAVIRFGMKFQQFTGPVMAKGLEDTSFYRYHPLISLNDVGGDPLGFGVTPDEFHEKTHLRTRTWPHSMLATSTHDSKLSEDVRARIDVLSEIPAQWRLKARQWRTLNHGKKRTLDGVESPTRNDEYLFYQVLLGAWPVAQDAPSEELRARFKSYMLKAVREAKQSTSWANPNVEYETALSLFVDEVLDPAGNQEFMADFLAFTRQVARIGTFNSLSQTLIKLTSPGVPDIYQGTELFGLRLVDPDNRQPVEFGRRKEILKELTYSPDPQLSHTARLLTDQLHKGAGSEGCAKLFLIWKVLNARRKYMDIFQDGEYAPLAVEGPKAANILAFARGAGRRQAVIAAPRMWTRILESGQSPLDSQIWNDTQIRFPAEPGASGYRNVMTGASHEVSRDAEGRAFLDASLLMKDFPWALLLAED